MNDKDKGQMMSPTVVGFVTIGIVLVVGIIVFGSFETASTSIGATTQATAAIANVTSNTYAGFNISALSPIVAAAAVILLMITFLRGRR